LRGRVGGDVVVWAGGLRERGGGIGERRRRKEMRGGER
jgi:hypothetical protein